MSIQAVSWALEQELPAGPKLVLVAIANHANHVDGYCWLRADTIAREASASRRNVFRIVGALIRNGYLRKEVRKGKDGKQRASDYWILFDRLAAPWHYFTVSEEDVDPQDVEVPGDTMSPGENDDRVTEESLGPGDTSGTDRVTVVAPGNDEPSLEPSKPKEIKKEGFDDLGRGAPRAYQPPPPAVDPPSSDPATKVFVIEGTPAWKAWDAHLRRTRGRGLSFSYRGEGEHRTKSGRHFPSLWPPPQTAADGVNEEAAKDFAEAETKRGDQC